MPVLNQYLMGLLGGNSPVARALQQIQQSRTAPAPPPITPRVPLSAAAGPASALPSLPEQGPRLPALPPTANMEDVVPRPGVASFAAGLEAAAPYMAGSYYTGPGPAFMAALGSGLKAFETARAQRAALNAQAKMKEAELLSYQSSVDSPYIPDQLRPVLRGMPPEKGYQIIEELVKQRGGRHVVGKTLVTGEGEALFAEPTPKTFDFQTVDGRLFVLDKQTGQVTAQYETPEGDPHVRIAFGVIKGDANTSWSQLAPKERDAVLQVIENLKRSGAPKTDIVVEGAKDLLGKTSEILANDFGDARNAVEDINSINSLIADAQKMFTGAGANFATALGAALVKLGLAPPDIRDKTEAAQRYAQQAARRIWEEMSRYGSGALRAFSEGDRKLLEQAKTPKPNFTADNIKRILEMQQELALRKYIEFREKSEKITSVLAGNEPTSAAMIQTVFELPKPVVPPERALKLFPIKPGETRQDWVNRVMRYVELLR